MSGPTVDSILGELGRALLEAMPDRTAVLDRNGRILATNRRWQDEVLPEEESPLSMRVGDDLLARFRAPGPVPLATAQMSSTIADGVADVLDGTTDYFALDLIHGAEANRWDRVQAIPLPGPQGGGVFRVADVTGEVLAERARIHAATHDTVTGLPNRILLIDRLDQALQRPGRTLVAVLHLDIDRFKLVNASLGPVVGDRVLAMVGHRLQSCLSAGESVARTGDDSFVVLTEVAPDELSVLALGERLLSALAEPLLVDAREVVVTASVGVAFAGAHYARAEDLLRDADVATTRAKEQGGGRLAIAHQQLRSASVHRLEIEQALRRALERGEFWLEYQPEVSLETGLVVGAEALLRWEHPTLGVLTPGEFIGVAEETGLIIPIGDWVLREACMQAASWALPAEDHRDLYVAVNVSGNQLAEPNLSARVSQALLESGLPPERLCVEVTESTVVQGWEVAQSTLRRLRRMGVRVALDDFGTGYSSFSYLLRLPVDLVKLDGSFVARLTSDPQDRAIVESVVTLARRLGMQVVAEGVEDERQRSVLARLGCHIVQGFDLGRPGDAAALLGVVWQRAAAAADAAS